MKYLYSLIIAACFTTSVNGQLSNSITFTDKQFGEGFPAKSFHSVTIDQNNTKWFVTEAGIVSFKANVWTLHNKNRKVGTKDLKEIAYDFSSYGHEVWVASPLGATVATIPVDGRTGATTYYIGNSKILSDNVVSVAVAKEGLRWFGTDKGISAFMDKKWLTPDYARRYPEGMFADYPITSMATSPDGDTLYVATAGLGVARVFRNEVDAISGASEYAVWGPLEIPSDFVYCVYVTPDGTQWFGTDMGVGKHVGYVTLENWTIYDKSHGLVDDFVQAIGSDAKGNMWFGTKGGLSVFDGTNWKSFTTADGLISNNILCIITDKSGVVWLGTDSGVMSFNNGEFVRYK